MDYRYFSFNKSCKITHRKQVFFRTDSGKSWKSKPEKEYSETITAEFYEYFVQSVPFFDGLFGGKCRARCGYTIAGYIPVVIKSINPDCSEMHVDYFHFE